MKNYCRILVVFIFIIGLCSCHSSSEKYRDVLREGSWYVYDIEYSYRLINKYETPELIDFFHFLLDEANLLFVPGDELVFSKKKIAVKCPNGDSFNYDYFYSGDFIEVGRDRPYMGLLPDGDTDHFSFSFGEQKLEDLLEDLAPTDEYYAYLLEAMRNNLREFHITYLLQRPVPEVAQIMSGIYVGPMYDGNQQLLNNAATLNLFWENSRMNLSLDEKVVLADESNGGPQFYVNIVDLEVEKGFTLGSYEFTGTQSITDPQYGQIEIRIANGRYNAAKTVSAEIVIDWKDNQYVLDYQKGIREWDYQSIRAKNAGNCIYLTPQK